MKVFFDEFTTEPLRSAQSKRDKISIAQSKMPPGAHLIFQPPKLEFLYTNQELIALLSPLTSMRIPPELAHVQKSHWVKDRVLEMLGYGAPAGYRTKEAKLHKPKFISQVLDIFAQSSNNLQVWNYIPSSALPIEFYGEVGKEIRDQQPTFADARYLIIIHTNDGYIKKIILKYGIDLADWDKTGTKTTKWQASIPLSLRAQAAGNIIVGSNDAAVKKLGTNPAITTEEKGAFIQKTDIVGHILIKEPPSAESTYTLAELGLLTKGCIGWKIKDPGPGGTRVIGQEFEKLVASKLGYKNFEQTDSGTYPDLLNQLVETKFQYSGTVDLGKTLPSDLDPIEDQWNKWDLRPADIRYLVALSSLDSGIFTIESLLILSGIEFVRFVPTCEGESFKVQMSIPAKELN